MAISEIVQAGSVNQQCPYHKNIAHFSSNLTGGMSPASGLADLQQSEDICFFLLLLFMPGSLCKSLVEGCTSSCRGVRMQSPMCMD